MYHPSHMKTAYLNLRCRCEQVKHVFHVNHVLLNGSVVGAKVVERSVELLHEGHKQHCISYSQLAICYTLHNSNETAKLKRATALIM